ncbi:hypothetical protein [Paraburkholderia bryophila]|uniref:Uncharacterized protein n=1 Tax=Paraburkholderia bryophila TaxID=420952 RepID=A0A329CF83_9BURK|nr:hypothetical protein [Paraburkholderia bryophila]RAS29755.1 hypothetical protein BX591_11030 [Paraburkholderia bryophila]
MSILFVSCRGLKKLDGVVGADFDGLGREDVIDISAEPEWAPLTEGLVIGAVYAFQEDQWFSVARNTMAFNEQLEKLAYLVRYDFRRSDADEPGAVPGVVSI